MTAVPPNLPRGEGPSVRSTCPYCGVGCGVILTPDGAGGLSVKGDPMHPANYGRLCSKGTALGETVGLEERLLTPRVFGQEVGWDAALGVVAKRFARTIAEHGPDAVALYVSGQLLTEDYYVANKLAKGFWGTANIDTNSRLCMASSVAGHRRAFGTDTVPGQYEDLELADLVVLVGSNLAWCHPVLYQRLSAAKAARPGMKVVVIDPRRTATCEIADLHLAIAPGGDVAVFNALLAGIEAKGCGDPAFLAHVTGAEAAFAAARATDASGTGLSDGDLRAFVDLWCGTEKVITVYSQGVNQSSHGTDKVNAILNCHLATGRIGRPGMGPFSVTGQPNAMGGREVGGLANMLACHMEIENPQHRAAVQAFWNAPGIAETPGLKAVDMFRAVADGRIKAIWIIHTNPVVSMPEADLVAEALRGCPFVVVQDITARTDTARLAHVLLPATAWAEKSGTVTNSERRISRQRAALPVPGQARDDWRILAEVAGRMGWGQAFGWETPAEIFAEHAALSGVAGAFGLDFDISDHASIDPARYDALAPFLWPATPRRRGGRFFGDGQFHTPDGKGRMLAVQAPTVSQPDGVRLNTGRIRDQWHTMTRTAKSPRLSSHLAEPFLELHPSDAEPLGLRTADLVEATNDLGRAILRVLVTDRVAPGHPFAPIHWTGETAPTGRVDALVAANPDPLSGQPDSKASTVALRKYPAGWYGFAVSAGDFIPDCGYWAKARIHGGWRAELAGTVAPDDWVSQARKLFALADCGSVSMTDQARGMSRVAFHRDGRLVAALFVGPDPVELARDMVIALLEQGGDANDALAGRARGGVVDAGPTVCACMNVGRNTICQAIATGRALTVAALGEALGAGTSCGSCRPELAGLITRFRCREAAE
ncbi:nitrate reductase [Tabrizicola sp.]|uniref:nitrate reductase n=1 Tax=Tabrizicola sp. TaxID=2005166 RepID=UPI002735066A|nr:nitrate reductase [Tabrizicola sp.]MDP3196112.1 molybdopterin-dependent oxidoreductase [Tabrizicola sp.]